jgi:hypothetical protein
MKRQALILSGVVALTVASVSTIAAVTYFQSRPPALEQQTPDNPTPSSPEPSTPTSTFDPPAKPLPAATPDTNFPHWRIKLVDESTQSPDFAQFYQQLKKAVRDRDAKFIRSIVTDKTKFGFGEHRSIDYLNPDNPSSPFWTQLEKALSLGCTSEEAFFSCPTTFRQFDSVAKNAPDDQKDTAYESSIIVVGEGVNVRSQPNVDAPAIATLTNEIVQFDSDTFQKASNKDRAETFDLNNVEGWTPVILPNDKHGYVSNRYAYSPLGFRALFAKENGKWMMQAFLAGD